MATGTLFYVHGAGNRSADAAVMAANLRAGFRLADPSRLAVSDWGQALAPDAALPKLDATLPPPPPGGQGLVAAGATPTLTDPWAPLAALEAPGGTRGLVGPPGRADADALLAFLSTGLVRLDNLDVAPADLARAARRVGRSAHYRAASADPLTMIDATATSAAALALGPRRPRQTLGLPGIPWPDIDALKGRIAEAIAGTGVLSVVSSVLGGALGPPVMLWATRMLEPHRAEIMHAHMLMAVDVLFYQRHGGAIRDHVRAELAALQGPVVALGHSLGGIILVDALFGPGAPAHDVALLVTFGSQSAFLNAIGALDAVSPNRPWLNIWSRTDFVSFLAGGLWPGLVTDRELVIDLGFPASHGSYPTTPGFFGLVTADPAFPPGLVGAAPPGP